MEMNYLLEGSGDKTIVFIHGLSDNLCFWQKLSQHLKDEYQILLYDIRGHGKSPYVPFTMDSLACDLHDLLLKLNIEKCSLIGLSMGGNIALSFALKYPDMAEKLIIMSSFSRADDNLKSKFDEMENAIRNSYEEFYDMMIKYVLPKDVFEKNKELLELYKNESAKSANIEAIENGIDIGRDFSITDRLKCISNPALILAGRDNELTVPALSKILNDNIENSQLVVFDNTKHNLLIGRNISEILKLIRKFI